MTIGAPKVAGRCHLGEKAFFMTPIPVARDLPIVGGKQEGVSADLATVPARDPRLIDLPDALDGRKSTNLFCNPVFWEFLF